MNRQPSDQRPAADVVIDAELVRGLLRAQHPDLAALPLRPGGTGWDNVVYRLGGGLALRLPRRAAAVALLENELRWLPALAPRLPVAVPAPLRRGAPTAGYPYPWAVVPWFEGTSAALFPARVRDGYAGTLAGFLRSLHLPAPADAPRNPVRGVPLAARGDAFRTRLAGWDSFRDRHAPQAPDASVLMAVWTRALEAPAHAGKPVWLHGDLHPHNLVAGVSGNLVAVGDFGDLASGDPATDLAAGWLHFTASGHGRFRAGLASPPGPGEKAAWERARGWAVSMALVMAMHQPAEPLHAVGLHALSRLAGEAG
ncbi:aminoglycoside phosphotransferase family protein [Zafaria cholistanensis]|uniref:aminoglycoside phosphotransferase family protein n=1 Tax=Zafaria cholistanensis TaxID=1682741 RepID=UPI001C0F0F26|nr:aminoglycoside phosphotransferase family protein [Zafaria cholistanensis]